MKLGNRILVVLNPAAKRQVALERAAKLAAATGAELRLQAVVYAPEWDAGIFNFDDQEEAAERKKRVAAALEWLEGEAAALDLPKVSVRANWGHPFDDIVLAVVEGYKPNLLMLTPRDGARGRLNLTEWRLLNRCPTPVWLVRAADWPSSPALMAAVDPTDADDHPARLDRDIVAAARALADAFGIRSIRLLHAVGEVPSAIGIAQSPADYERELRAARHKRVTEIVPEDLRDRVEIEISTREPALALRKACAENQADLVVMGMLARSRLAERIIGSTARDFIPRSTCDLVLIKPRD